MQSILTSAASNIEKLLLFANKNKTKKILIIVLILLSALLRFWKIEYMPMADDADELAYIYAGQSLYQYGVPISWSSFTYEENIWRTMTFDSDTTNKTTTQLFVKPWFDHPMLLPVIMGPLVSMAGYTFPSVPPALLFRLPMLIMSVVTLLMVYKLAHHFFGYWPAVFSLAIAAGSPVLVFIQRMVVGENVVALCLLIALYLYIVEKKVFLTALVTILAVQAKVVGLVVAPIISLAMVLENNWKKAFIFGLSTTAISLGIFFLTGYGLAGDSFLQALAHQSNRLVGWSNPSGIFSHAGLQNFDMYDFSYYLILILGITGTFLSIKTKTKILPTVIFILLSLIWVTSAEKSFLGWYKIPLFMMLSISAAGWIAEKKLFLPITLVGITIVNNLGLVRYPTAPLPDTEILRTVVFLTIAAILTLLLWVKGIKYQVIILSALVVVYLAQAAYVSDKYFEGICTDVSGCTVPTVTFSGFIRDLL